jgi:hypothetical protein
MRALAHDQRESVHDVAAVLRSRYCLTLELRVQRRTASVVAVGVSEPRRRGR